MASALSEAITGSGGRAPSRVLGRGHRQGRGRRHSALHVCIGFVALRNLLFLPEIRVTGVPPLQMDPRLIHDISCRQCRVAVKTPYLTL